MTEQTPLPIEAIVSKLQKTQEGEAVVSLLRLRQILHGDVVDSENKGYGVGDTEEGVWENVFEHSITVMYVVDTLAEALKVPNEDRSKLIMAALLHDANKKAEKLWLKHIQQTNPKDKTKRIEKIRSMLESLAAMEDAENALDGGIDPKILTLMHANIPSPNDLERGQTLIEKIMWFGDMSVQGNDIVTVEERFNRLENDPKNGAFNKDFSESFKAIYGGRSLYEVQRGLGKQYEQEFAQKLGKTVPEFYNWLRQEVLEKIRNKYIPFS